MIGTLASKEELYSNGWRDNIFVNKYNSLQFNIKLISEGPESFPNNKYFTVYTSDIEECGFEDDSILSEYERIDKLREFLSRRLLIFKPVKKGENFVVKDVKIVQKPQSFNEKSTYKPIPVFNSKKIMNKNFDDFMKMIKEKSFVGDIEGISNEIADTPSLIAWREGNDIKIIGDFDSHIYAFGGFKFEYNYLKHKEFEKEWYEDIIVSSELEELLFVGRETYLAMEAEIKEFENTNKETSTEEKEKKEEIFEEKEKEKNFINKYIKKADELGLIYDELDLINFHTAMKSSNLVILAGMSGTGKSKLIQVYGEAMGLDNYQLNIIPVRPSWADDGDLLGYVDFIHNIYKPGDVNIINTLVQASKNMDKIYIVCFDEMNLARVEHYFSQFLSVLEMDGKYRKLNLYNNELENRLYNSDQYPASISIGENVLFVGTVNLDESTYNFSDKVLDRANVITLNIPEFVKIKDLKSEKKSKFDEITFSEYKSFKSTEYEIKLTDREIEFLNLLHKEMNKINRNMGIGFRIIKQIDVYIKNIPTESKLTRENGLDLQIAQRILTKIRGPQEQLQEFIGDFDLDKKTISNSIFLDILDEYSDISQFNKSKEIIKQKAKELKIYGYTI